MAANTLNTLGRNIAFQIYNGDGTPFEGLILHKSVVDSVVMSLGDNITGDVYYKDNTLQVTMQEYIEYKRNPNDENEDPVRFVLVSPPTIVREGMVRDNGELKGMTKYSFTFYHPMYQLGNMPFCDVAVSSDQQRYLSENKVFSWIGYPDDYIAKLNKNLDGTEWIVEKSNRFPVLKDNVLSEVLSFENNTIADALKKFYDTWEVPYVVDVVSSGETSYAQGKRFKVVIGLPSNEIYASESDRQLMQPYVFRMGQGVGLKNNSRTPRNNKIITRISGYGSEDNIPYGYPQIVWDGAEDDPRLEYPLYDGIVGGRYVKLIKHPFTRKYLMPSIYSETVNKKVNPNAVGYDPTIDLKDYYDAIRTEEYPYVNEINPLAPSYESHQFDVKPEMDDGQSNVEILNAIPLNADLTPAETWDDTMDGDGNYSQSYFQITLPQLSFDLYACAAITQEMQINMRGGACIGCTFPIQVDWDDYKANFYDQYGNFAPDGEQRNLAKYPKSNLGSISVVVQKEYQTFGTIMPNVFKQPKNGDKFVVLGISLPSEYISNAEKRLDGEMKSYMLENNVHYYDYPLKFDEYFLATHTNILAQIKPNAIIHFRFGNIQQPLELYVKQLTIKYGQGVLPQYDITLTDNIEVVLNQIGQVADGVERLSSVISMMREGYSRNVWTEIAKKLSKTSDDTARGKITFLKGLEAIGSVLIRGVLTAWAAVMNSVRSDNYTDDTGWELTNDNGAGASQLTVDYIRARRKLIAESIEVKERHASAGDVILTEATAEISRVDYLDSEGNQLGVHPQKVPFTLNGVLLMLRKVMGTSRLEPRGIAADSRTVRGALSAAERQRIARVRCYFLASDGERDVENWWAVGDLAYCMTQNLTRTPRDSRMGASEKAGNVFWWRQVIAIDADGAVTLEDGKEYHYIDFAVNYAEEKAGTYNNSAYLSDLPAPGDKCMQFGNVSNPDRMHAIMAEVNGTGNINAPDIVFYRGIYTYNLERCWWGGESCRKAKLSPSTGYEFTGPDFKFITEYGQARVPVDRGAWFDIPKERDVREPHEKVRKCYYFDRVTHLGSLWLCINADNYIWLKNEGTAESPVWNYWGTTDPRTQPDYSDDLYRRVLDYTTVEPSDNAPTVWQKQVSKGETPVPVSAYQWNQSPTVAPSQLPATGATLPSEGWTATAPSRPGNGYYLWMTMCSRYGDGSYTPWGDAVCITGGQGSAGEDAKEREWIYIGKSEPTTFSGATLPANIKKDADGTTRTDDYIATTDDFVPQGWHDTAIAIDETTNRYVYASWRVWDKQTQRWGSFQPPILWGNWGVKGEDGDGVQYVFRLFDHELSDTERETTYKPTRQGLEPTQEGEWIPAGWSDDPLSTTSQMQWCYCSTIKRIGGEWGDFEKLALWSKWSKDGTSPWVADLDNEMDSVACYADGHPTSEQTVTTGVSLMYGSELRTPTIAVYKDRACEQPYTNSDTLENGLAVYWTIGARSNHTVSVKVDSALTISGSMNFYVKITDGESSVNYFILVFTVNGIRPGDDGKPATIYNLLPSEKQVSVGRNADGTYNPATFSLTCGYTKNVGGVMTTVPNVTEQIDGKYCLYYRLRNRSNQTWGTYRRYDTVFQPLLGVSVASYDQVEFVLSTEDAMIVATMDANTVIDRETVPVVSDGKQGEQGNNGDDAVTVRFSRNPVVFQGNSLGQSVNTTAIRIYPVVYVGGTPVNATSVTLKSKPSGLNVDIRNVAAEWDGVDTQPVDISPTGIGVAEGALTGIVELTIGYGDNKTITGSVVTTVAHSGTSGNGMKEIFKVSDTKPATPSGTDVLPTGWSEQPPVLATGLTYTVTGDWTRSGNTLTSPATTEDEGVYRSRVSFTTNGKATIAVRLTVSSEETYDIAAISAADNNFLEGKTAGDIRDYSGTDLVAILSGDGTTGVFLLTVNAEGEHFFDVVYAKDSSTDDYNDNAVLELNLDAIWVSTSKIVTDASGNETAAGWSEPVRWNGPQGKMGRNFYYDGVYDSRRTYSVTDYEAPFVSYGANYYVRVGEGSCQGVTPSAGSPYWDLMTSTFKYLITMAIFSEYAKLGSWVFNKDYMFSEMDALGVARGNKQYYGIGDSGNEFTPSASIDGLTGRASFSGDNVRFNPDGSGWVAGQNIKWYANGSAEFSGKITATSGSIAGFEINTDYLGTHNDYRTQGFVMNKQSLAYYYGGKYVSIGTNDNAISVTGFSGATALYTDGGRVLHKLGANDSFTVGDASSVNTGETVILSKFEARGDVAIGGSVITDSSMQDYLPLAANTRKGQLLLFSSGDWEIKTSSSVWIYNEDGVVTDDGSTFERTGPFMLVCVGKNKNNVALWQYFNGR